MKVIYIAGPFRGDNNWLIENNIRNAENLALRVWSLGNVAVICPHTNARFFSGALSDRVWLDGDIELLHRSDAVMLTCDWARSNGATIEREIALSSEKPVFDKLEDLKNWLKEQEL